MTMREVDFSLRKIHLRRHENYRAQAALHGLKVNPIISPSKENNTDPKKSEIASKLMQEAIARRKAEMNG